MNFEIGDVVVTKNRGRWEIVDRSPFLLQIQEESGNQFWLPYADLIETISGKKSDEEQHTSRDVKLQRLARRKRTRRSRPLQETDSFSDS